MTLARLRCTRALLAAWALACAACISVPADVRAEFSASTGTRPNNYGRLDDRGRVVPDRPTIPPPAPAPAPAKEAR